MNFLFAVLNDPPCIITKNGKIYSRRYNRHPLTERVQKVDKRGYCAVTLKNKTYKVHRLVAEAWLGKCPKGLEVDHIDRNKLNNSIDNLRYVTKSENCYNRHTSTNTKYNLHWGSPGSEEWKEASKIYSKLKRDSYSLDEKKSIYKLIHCRNKKRLSSLGLFKTVRIIDGKRKNVVLPLSEKCVRRRDKDGRFFYERNGGSAE